MRRQALQRYVRMLNQQQRLEVQLKALADKLPPIEQQIMDWMAGGEGDQPISNIHVGNRTLYIAEELYVNVPADQREAVTRTLRRLGLGDFVVPSFSTARIKAWIRELKQRGEPIPASLAKRLKITEVHQLRSRKAE